MHVADPAHEAAAARLLAPNPFAGDDGSRPVAFAAAKAVEPPQRTPAVVAALRDGRVLVPVRAHARPATLAEAESCDQSTTMTVEVPDGRSAMPVFTSIGALTAWDPAARPLPVRGPQAAHAATELADGLLLVDPGDEPVLVPRPAVVALARGEEWVPPWADPTLGQVVARALAGIDELVGARVEPGRTTEVRVVLAVRPGLAAERLADAMRRATAALGDDAVIRVRVDSLELYPTSLV